MEIKPPTHFLVQALLLIAISASIVIHGMLAFSPPGRYYTLDANIPAKPPLTSSSSFSSSSFPNSGDTAGDGDGDSLALRVITHNIRYDAGFFSRFPHEPPWSPTRHRLLTSQLQLLTRLHFTPLHTVVFLQEALHNQFRDVADTSLGAADWVALGVGRDDGKSKGEHEAVYYRKAAWRLVHWETRWLNEDGRVGGKGWDASTVRTVTCVVLDDARAGVHQDAAMPSGGENETTKSQKHKQKQKQKRVLFLNAHLDDQGVVARRESAKLLLLILAELRRKWHPDYWVVGGDFNSGKSDDAYETMVNQTSGLLDVGTVGKHAEQWGDYATYTGFDGAGERHPSEVDRIDFLFVPKPLAVAEDNDTLHHDEETTATATATAQHGIQGYAVIPNSFEGSKLGRVSDHRAVVVDLLV